MTTSPLWYSTCYSSNVGSLTLDFYERNAFLYPTDFGLGHETYFSQWNMNGSNST